MQGLGVTLWWNRCRVDCITCADRLASCAGHLQVSRRERLSFILSQLTTLLKTLTGLELQLSLDNVMHIHAVEYNGCTLNFVVAKL